MKDALSDSTMADKSLLSSQPDGHEFWNVFSLLVDDFAKTADRPQTSSFEV